MDRWSNTRVGTKSSITGDEDARFAALMKRSAVCIVADGERRYREARDYRATRKQIFGEVSHKGFRPIERRLRFGEGAGSLSGYTSKYGLR